VPYFQALFHSNTYQLKTAYRFLLVVCLAPLSNYAQSENWHFNSLDTIRAGIEMHDRESYDSAITMFNKIHPGDTNYALAIYEKAFSSSLAGYHEEALALGRQGYALNSNLNVQFATIIGNSLDDLDRSEEAEAVYDSAIAVYPGSALLYYNRGVTHTKKERWDQGIKDFKKAIELNPYHASSHYQLANLAMRNGNFTQALLSLGYFFIAEPSSNRSLAILQDFNTALSEKTEFEAIDYDFDPEGTYSKSDRLIKSYAALRDAYEIDSEANYPMMKQMHLAIHQSVKLRNKSDFWAMYYLPYYKQLVKEDLFETYSHLVSVSIQNEFFQDLTRDNLSEIKELVTWNSDFIKNHHGLHPIGYEKGAEEIKFYFFDGTDGISARGKVDKDENPTGVYEFYYDDGSISGSGELNSEGQKIGEHKSYHPNGELKQVAIYKDGKLNGLSTEYYDNGATYAIVEFSEGNLNGPATIHHTHGAKHREFTFKDNVAVDTLFVYHNNGQLQAKLPQKEGTDNGLATFFHEDGNLLSNINFKDGKRTGPAEFFYPNGQLDVKAVYNDEGNYDGEYESYHANGQLHEKGIYVDGIRTGKWKTYNPDGKLIAERSLDERGKKTGTEIYYDDKGRKTELFEYKKEEIVFYEDYNLKGEVQSSGKDKRGELDYKDFDLYGSLTREGIFDETHRIGLWKEYDQYGNLIREISYSEDGEYDGDNIDYFAYLNGEQQYSVHSYNLDTLHGPFVYYYASGKESTQGTYYNGKRDGLCKSYYPNGKVNSEFYYVNGEYNGPRKYFDPEGNLRRIEYYKEGTITRMESYYNDSIADVADMKDPLKTLSLKYPNGQLIFEIERTGAQFQGSAKWYYGNGQLEIESSYVDGNRDGKRVEYYPNGKKRSEGFYDLGRKVGEWKYYHDNGQLEEVVTYVEGEIHGPNAEYNPEGIRVDSLNYVFDDLDGNRYFYSEEGELQHVRVYDLDKIIGWRKVNKDGSLSDIIPIENGTAAIKAYYPNGKLAMEYTLEKGYFTEAPYKTYYSSGQIESEIQHKNGLNNGWSRSYYPTGKLKSEVEYIDGYKNGVEKEYHANGQLARETSWVYGEVHGSVKTYDESGKLLSNYLYVADDLYE